MIKLYVRNILTINKNHTNNIYTYIYIDVMYRFIFLYTCNLKSPKAKGVFL